MRPKEDEWIELEDCYINHTTDMALQVHHDGEVFWIPRSVIQDDDEFEKHDEHCLILVKEWFARKEGLI